MAIYFVPGVPRHVNKIGSRLMLHGSSEERHALDDSDVMAVVGDLRKELLAPLAHDGEPLVVVSDKLSSPTNWRLYPRSSHDRRRQRRARWPGLNGRAPMTAPRLLTCRRPNHIATDVARAAICCASVRVVDRCRAA